MGAHLNYAMLIYHLVLLKDEFHRIRNLKYQELIKELQLFQVEPHSDCDHLPYHHELANKLKISQAKMYSLLKGLYEGKSGHKIIQELSEIKRGAILA